MPVGSELQDSEVGVKNFLPPKDEVPDASWLLSGLYCMLVVILSLVICSTHYITPDVTEVTVDAYYMFLCAIGTIWLAAFRPMATSRCRGPNRFQVVKSTHSTNRWLKGILAVFGIAIIVKDILEFLTIFQYEEARCKKAVYFMAPIVQIIFIISEVNFLFRFSKIHLQHHQQLSRFGIMHVMATNLSIWMLIIIDESMSTVERHPDTPPTLGPLESYTSPDTHQSLSDAGCNTSQVEEILMEYTAKMANLPPSSYASEQIFGPEGCYCNTSYCAAVSDAHTFLYPFLIEFSLVASCMMYIVWKNIGMRPRHTGPSVKPAYKFYKSYKGLVGGCIILIGTAVVLVFINNTDSDVPDSDRNYDTETTPLIITNSFMVIVEVVMLIVCITGLVLFNSEPRPVTASMNLDTVLLLTTITGTAALDIFYIFSVYASMISSRYEYAWIWGAIYPIIDLIQCIVQVAFLLYGLSRQPVVEENSTVEMKIQSPPPSSRDSGIHDDFTNASFKNDENLVIKIPVELESSRNPDEQRTKGTSFSDDLPIKYEDIDSPAQCSNVSTEIPSLSNNVEKNPDEAEGAKVKKGRVRKKVASCKRIQQEQLQERIRLHSERPKVSPPNTTRLYIRDSAMFLLIANACLWMFWSLEGTAFKLSTYPYQYYTLSSYSTRNTWHTVTMFCLPLSIFFRMHSCACLFELWSFT